MSIDAVILFGSRARKDAKSTSDTDLLFITSEENPRHLTHENLSMSMYSFSNLLIRARRGDLFLMHIILEGRALYDPNKRLEQLRQAFVRRASYGAEIRQAADVGWYLVRFDRSVDPRSLVAKRIAWCVRTILIARSVERGSAVFSPPDLAKAHPLAVRLIANRNANLPSPGAIAELREFLLGERLSDPVSSNEDEAAFARLFKDTGNSVGLSLLRHSRSGGASGYL